MQFRPDELALHGQRRYALGADPHEWRQHHVTGIAPKRHGLLSDVERHRAKVLFGIRITGAFDVQHVRRRNVVVPAPALLGLVVPHRRGQFLPGLQGYAVFRVIYRADEAFLAPLRPLAEHQQVFRHADAAEAGVLLEGLPQQAVGIGLGALKHRIAEDRDAAVEGETLFQVELCALVRERTQTRRTVLAGVLVIDQILDVDRGQPARAQDAELLAHHVAVLFDKLGVRGYVAHVGRRFRIDIQARKRRRIDAEIDAVVGQTLRELYAIRVVGGPSVAEGLFEDVFHISP